jgi:hypothetical protein
MFYFAVFFGDICQLLDQCCLSQLIQLQNVEWPQVHDSRFPNLRSRARSDHDAHIAGAQSTGTTFAPAILFILQRTRGVMRSQQLKMAFSRCHPLLARPAPRRGGPQDCSLLQPMRVFWGDIYLVFRLLFIATMTPVSAMLVGNAKGVQVRGPLLSVGCRGLARSVREDKILSR